MNEGRRTKVKSYTVYNKAIIKRLVEKYGFTAHFIYASLRGDRNSESSIKICEDYRQMATKMNKMLQNL